MGKEIIKLFIAHNDPNVLRYLSVETPREFEILGAYAHIATAATFRGANERVEKEYFDIYFIDFNWEDEDGHGEALIEFIKKIAPYQAIIVIFDDTDDCRLKLYDKYYPIICPSKEMLFSNLGEYLEKALLSLTSHSREVVINTQPKFIRFYLEEVAYIYGHAGKTIIFIYDFDAKKYKEQELPLTLTSFLAKYNKSGDFLRCHRDYAVNRLMIRFVHKSREHQCIELIYRDENDYPIEIPMSDSGKKSVIKEMNREMEGIGLI